MAEKDWTEELKAKVVEAYEGLNPTPETTMDIVKEIAVDFDKTPNGIRMVLTRAGVYIKKTPATSASSSSSEGSKRVNKTQAIDELKKKIVKLGQEVDADICDRLTGKAAVYILGIIEAVS